MNEIHLSYVHYLGLNAEQEHQYLFFFTPSYLEMCNENWQEEICGLFNDIFIPDENTISYQWTTSIPLGLITKNLCLGMKHAIDNVVALGWEDISDYEEYPDDGRVILYYGMKLNEVEEILKNKDGIFQKQ